MIDVAGNVVLETTAFTTSCPADVRIGRVRVQEDDIYARYYIEPTGDCEHMDIIVQTPDLPYKTTVHFRPYVHYLKMLLNTRTSQLKLYQNQLQNYRRAAAESSLDVNEYQLRNAAVVGSVIYEIIASRSNPDYLSPVRGVPVATQLNKLPNAGRPYRAGYTDGIHHGWDFDAPIGQSVRAMDDGVIIYMKRDFDVSEFDTIDYSDHVHAHDTNLDILR